MTINELQEVSNAAYSICREGISYEIASKDLNDKQLVLLSWSIV